MKVSARIVLEDCIKMNAESGKATAVSEISCPPLHFQLHTGSLQPCTRTVPEVPHGSSGHTLAIAFSDNYFYRR
jgi:hypothetical protein